MKRIFYIFLEPLFFIAALVYLAVINPVAEHFSFCLFSHLGIWCPGCGLGRAISLILHGKISLSFETHILGFPALLLFLHRIFMTMRQTIKTVQSKTRSYGPQLHAQFDS